MGTNGPQRIVCLTAETTEIAFALGRGERVVGVSGYAVRPPEARKKPRVAALRNFGHRNIRHQRRRSGEANAIATTRSALPTYQPISAIML